jgi:hypothetical protein
MKSELEPSSRFRALFEKPIVLYGAGITGVETYKILTHHLNHVDVACFCDAHKTGKMAGLDVISPEELRDKCATEGTIVIVTALADNHREIEDRLRDLSIGSDLIYTLSELNELIAENIEDPRVGEWYRTIRRYKSALPNDRERHLYLNWWCPEHYCDNDILVYQSGKVGSSSICNSLTKLNINVTHVHMLTDSFIYDLVPELAWAPTIDELHIIRKSSKYCSDRIKMSEKLKIITLVREPLIRDYSQFLYHMDELVRAERLPPEGPSRKAFADGIRRRATQNGKCKYGYQFEWFDQELKAVFGIDVYAHPFDAEVGYSIITQGNIDVLVVKLERLNELENVVGAFVGAPHFKLINTNEAKNKSYSARYKSFRRFENLPREVVDMYYDGNRLMNHFYAEVEREVFLRGWMTGFAR